MKLGKVRNIDKDVCVAEQVLAYKESFYCTIHCENMKDINEYKKWVGISIRNIFMDDIYADVRKKRNIKVIAQLMLNNAEKYLNYSNSHIINDYAEVGRVFSMDGVTGRFPTQYSHWYKCEVITELPKGMVLVQMYDCFDEPTNTYRVISSEDVSNWR